MKVTLPSDREILIESPFAASRELLFAAMTQPAHLPHWMEAAGMKLVGCEVDLRPGGSLRHTYQRPSGRTIEVRGRYEHVDAPHGYSYVETYDFSPLQVHVSVELLPVEKGTMLRQRLTYASKQERDEDLNGVSTSSAEAFDRLDAYLRTLDSNRN